MLQCWRTNPAERPNFRQMNEALGEIQRRLSEEDAVIQLDGLNEGDKFYPSYLQPIQMVRGDLQRIFVEN